MQLPMEREPTLLSENRSSLQVHLLAEELEEYKQAIFDEDIEQIADALGDLVVVAIGAMCEHGLPIERVMRAIYESNMSKLDENNNPIFREDGKLLKGPNFKEPDLSFLKSKVNAA